MENLIQTILIVDDNEINRKTLFGILKEDYEVLQAQDGKQAMHLLLSSKHKISAVLLDLVMPVMDGYDVLSAIKESDINGLPVIVTTGNFERENETKAFSLGAWDFVSKPYDPQILKYRLQSAIARSENDAFEKMKHMAEHDLLTGLHNRSKFFGETELLLHGNENISFAFVSFDIDRFALLNTFFGNKEGDKLLKCIANGLDDFLAQYDYSSYGRIEADQFAFCCNISTVSALQKAIEAQCEKLKKYPLDFEIVLTFGIYEITDRSISARQMLDNANLAAKKVKGHYGTNISVYNDQMGRQLFAEQEIINEMNEALEKEQFSVYIQPKYDLRTGLPAGGEALVRWEHPTKGMIMPGTFIPVFEKNGFIAKLDYYVWEKTCCILEDMVNKKIPLFPISVNVSRVHLYHPQLAEFLCQMVDRHHVPHEMFRLELTESIYTENSLMIQESITKLHNKGFKVLMDDFGSGYSSLNVLKDVEFDILKIDMQFFENTANQGRGESIIASIIRMAKWLGLPTVAEGVEKQEQVNFLRDMGCEYVQGYFFAKPMPVNDYKTLLANGEKQSQKQNSPLTTIEFWENNSQIELLFSTIPQPTAIYEFCDDKIDLLRVNNAFNDTFGYDDIATNSRIPQKVVPPEYMDAILTAFHAAIESRDTGECDYLRFCFQSQERWIHIKLKYISGVNDKHILVGTLWDITTYVKMNQELQRYKKMLGINCDKPKTMLIVDDNEVNREILVQMFQDEFSILQAQNGLEAEEILRANEYNIDIILLDLIMPVMDGVTFLRHKKENEIMFDIPVVIISADTNPIRQVDMMALGANDYISKPFVREVAIKRVNNVMESSERFHEMVKEYYRAVELSKKDSLTGTYNRIAVENMINEHLCANRDCQYELLMLDIDNFKSINDTYGHTIGDQVLKEIAARLQDFFVEHGIIGRLGGDEFIVFMTNANCSVQVAQQANRLCEELNASIYTDKHLTVSVSIGISISDITSDFLSLYEKADHALYSAKKAGKKQTKIYSEKEREVLK